MAMTEEEQKEFNAAKKAAEDAKKEAESLKKNRDEILGEKKTLSTFKLEAAKAAGLTEEDLEGKSNAEAVELIKEATRKKSSKSKADQEEKGELSETLAQVREEIAEEREKRKASEKKAEAKEAQAALKEKRANIKAALAGYKLTGQALNDATELALASTVGKDVENAEEFTKAFLDERKYLLPTGANPGSGDSGAHGEKKDAKKQVEEIKAKRKRGEKLTREDMAVLQATY